MAQKSKNSARERFKDAVIEGGLIIVLGQLLSPIIGWMEYSLLVLSYIWIQALNVFAYVRALNLSAKTSDLFVERHWRNMTPEDVETLYEKHNAVLRTFSLYSPVSGIRIWLFFRSLWRRVKTGNY